MPIRASFLALILAVAASAAPINESDVAAWIEAAGGRYDADASGKITAVDLTATWVSDADLGRLSGLDQLETIDLSRTAVSDIGIERLKSLESIRTLRLRHCHRISDTAVGHIKHWKQIEHLDLQGARITSRAFDHLQSLVSLKHLDISHSDVDDNGFDQLAALTKLESLACGGNHLSGVALTMLKLLPALKTLDVSGIQRVDSGLWGLALSDINLERIAELKQLETLSLAGATLSDRGVDRPGHELAIRKEIRNLSKLAGLENLKSINLSRLPISAIDVTVLKTMPRLRQIDLSQAPRIDDEITEILEALPELETVYLAATALSDEGLSRLQSQANLKQLSVGGTKVSEAAARKFRQARPGVNLIWYPPGPQIVPDPPKAESKK